MTRAERRSLHLHRVIALRLAADPERILAQARRSLESLRRGRGSPSQPLREWAVLLDRPLRALVEVLTDPSPWARELRHESPFGDVLTPAETRAALRSFSAEEERRR
jgi:hypothetical protein